MVQGRRPALALHLALAVVALHCYVARHGQLPTDEECIPQTPR